MPSPTPARYRWLPFLTWPRPSAALLYREALAGLTVGLILVPQGVAYAALAGMPLISGIYASLLPAIVAVLWSSSTRLGVGPTALSSLLIGTSLTGLATPGSTEWVALAAWLALLSGLLQLGLGLARAGWLLKLVTSSVLTGFTQAAALLIMASQLPALLGLRTTWNALWSSPSLHHFDGHAATLGLGSLLFLVLGRRLRPSFPTALFVLALAALAAWASGFADAGGAVIGALPAGLPALYWPGWPTASDFAALAMPVLTITLVSFLETASSAKVDHQGAGTRWDENQDLIAHGMAKISAGLCAGFPTSASFSRSALNLYAGAQSGWATLFATLLVLLVLLWLTPWLYHVPQAALAALIIAAVTSLIKPRALVQLWRISPVEALICALTWALTLVSTPHLYAGVLAGIVLHLCHFLYLHLHPRIIEVGLHADGSLRDRHLWALPPIAPGVLALRMDAALDFASAASLEQHVLTHLAAHPDTLHLCLFAQPITRIDVTGTEVFLRLRSRMRQRGGCLHLSGLTLPVQNTLTRAQALTPGSDLALYRTDGLALQALMALTAPPEIPPSNTPT